MSMELKYPVSHRKNLKLYTDIKNVVTATESARYPSLSYW